MFLNVCEWYVVLFVNAGDFLKSLRTSLVYTYDTCACILVRACILVSVYMHCVYDVYCNKTKMLECPLQILSKSAVRGLKFGCHRNAN